MDALIAKLSEHFPPHKVSWRVGSTNKEKTKGMALAYIDARDVMQRLDDAVGPMDWQDHYEETPSGRVICTLAIRCPETQEWIKKSDGAGSTGFEGEKGGISDAFKRAAVKWGIGRYLYDCKAPWVALSNGYLPKDFNGTQYLPNRPAFSSKAMKTKYYKGLKAAAADDDSGKARELWDELDNEQRNEIWHMLGPESGVRSTIKSLLEATGAAA